MITGRPDQGATGRCIIHVGMPKTATKTLQMRLFARHSQVAYLGTYSGANKHHLNKCRDDDTARLFNEIVFENDENPDWDLCRGLYERAVAPALRQGLVPVFSWESLLENYPNVQRRRAENLKRVFGRCGIIATIRHPLKMVESLYLQLLKRDNVGGYSRFGSRVRFDSIGEWIMRDWDADGHPPKVHLEYPEGIEIYSGVFGRENVGVFLFEQLVADPDAYYSAICRFVGIDAAEALDAVRGEKENERWTDKQLRRLETIARSPIKSLLFRFSSRPLRRLLLGLPIDSNGVPAKGGRGAKPPIPDELRERILDKTRAGNRRLKEQWNLALDEYGYPL